MEKKYVYDIFVYAYLLNIIITFFYTTLYVHNIHISFVLVYYYQYIKKRYFLFLSLYTVCVRITATTSIDQNVKRDSFLSVSIQGLNMLCIYVKEIMYDDIFLCTKYDSIYIFTFNFIFVNESTGDNET